MCRRKTLAMQTIEAMCASQNMNPDILAGKAKLFLKTYRSIHWSAVALDKLCDDDSYCFSAEQMYQALNFLSDLDPDMPCLALERKLRELFDPRWIAELVKSSLVQVHSFHKTGPIYNELLQTLFINTHACSESDLLGILGVERSRLYELKKEAFLVFALALWGTVLPKITELVEEESLMPYEF